VVDGRGFEATPAHPLVQALLKIAGSTACPFILVCCQVQEKLVAAAAAAEAASAEAAMAMAQAEASAAAAQHAQQQLQQVTQEAAARLASQVSCCHRRGRGGHHSDADSASDLPYLNVAERAAFFSYFRGSTDRLFYLHL
jgi:hypothetical protein